MALSRIALASCVGIAAAQVRPPGGRGAGDPTDWTHSLPCVMGLTPGAPRRLLPRSNRARVLRTHTIEYQQYTSAHCDASDSAFNPFAQSGYADTDPQTVYVQCPAAPRLALSQEAAQISRVWGLHQGPARGQPQRQPGHGLR